MDNAYDDNTLNQNTQSGNNYANSQNAGPQQSAPVFTPAQYTGRYTNPTYCAPYNSAPNTAAGSPAGYNTPQYTPQNTQPNTPHPNTVSAAPYNQNTYTSPSVIYNNAQTGSAPQYHYGNPTFGGMMDNRYYREHQEKLRKRRESEKKIKNVGNASGIALFVCFWVASMFSFLLLIPQISDLYNSGLSGQALINLFYSLIVVGATFFVFGQIVSRFKTKDTKKRKYKINTRLNAPKDPIKAALLIVISFGGCMLANYVTSIIISVFESFGIYSGYSSVQNPSSVTDIILMFIGTAIIPPLVEEYAMRGVLLSYLQKYGNIFAIVGSAFVFGVFHGNFAQMPFAFICGMFFAYSVIATDSIWTGIIIHTINNSLSCISSVLLTYFDENVASTFFYFCSVGGIILGGLALTFYLLRYKNDGVFKAEGEATALPQKTKIAKFITSPAMIVATVVYLLQAFLLLTTTPTT